MQLTIRNVPLEIKRRLQEQARLKQTSLNQAVVNALAAQTFYKTDAAKKRDVTFFTATAEDIRILDETVAYLDKADLETQNADRDGHKSVSRSNGQKPRRRRRGK